MAAGGRPRETSARGEVRLLCGPHGSGRAACIDSIMLNHWGWCVLLVPTRTYALRRLEDIILKAGLPGVLGRPVLTFDDFAADLLGAEGNPPARVGDFERRLLLEDALARVSEKPSLAALGAAAETPGFVSQMLRVITEIKQAAVDPGRFRAYAAGARSFLDPVVADVYEAYQAALLEAGVYDVPGLFWQADVVCRERRPLRLRDIDAVLLDGFDDFTLSEFNLLASLRPHVQLLALGLNCDTAPNRRDLYAGPLRTARRIEREFLAAVESFETPAPRTFTEFAAASVFWRDQPAAPPEGLRRNLEIVPCADVMQEVETVGRRIKRLIAGEGAAPGDIALVYPSLAGQEAAIRSVFCEFGIPLRFLEFPKLWESSIGPFVLALLEAIDEWQRETVVDVLTSPWFKPGRPHTDAIPSLARAASIISGRAEWRHRLEALAARIERDAPDAPRAPDDGAALEALMAGVDTLEGVDAAFPAEATAAEFIDALRDALDRLDIAGAVRACTVAEIRERETAALEALTRMLGSWRAWSRGGGKLSRVAFAAEFRQALQQSAFRPAQPREAVVCAQAQAVRHLAFDHVFFAGMNEGDMPGPPRISAVYSERNLEDLARAGIELERRYAHIEREMLRFHHVLCAARKHLCITWRTSSPRGQEQFPSPYVNDLLELFPGKQLQAPMPHANDFVPPLDAAASWRDARNAAFAAQTGEAAGLRARFPQFVLAAGMETARRGTSPFGMYDGVLADAAIVERVAAGFGREHVFSVNQIETYAACPFRFFVERVLGVEQQETPSTEFDALVRGNILHEVLQMFHARFHRAPAASIAYEDAVAALDGLVEEAFDRQGWRSVNAPPAIVGVEKLYAKTLLLRYLENERRDGGDQWQPAYFEAAFGRAHGGPECPVAKPDPFSLGLECGPILFAGRIDRIDMHPSGAARIVDYKTSKVPEAREVKQGRSLQLAVYALALEQLLMPGTTCAEAVFVSIGRKARRRLPRDEHWENPEPLCETIQRYVEDIRAGRFPPAPADPDSACLYCSAKRACRFEEGRIEAKSTESGEDGP